MTYLVHFTPGARRDLRRTRGQDRARITAAINGLATNPRPRGFKKLRGATDLFRVRAGRFRVIYHIEDDRLIVLVVRIGRRDDIYEKDLES